MDKKSIDNWRNFTNSPKYVLSESGLSRVWTHITSHDTAILSAFRNDPLDNSECSFDSDREEGGNTTLQVNKDRNRDLKAALLYNRYGVTKADGAYVENYLDPEKQIEVKEDSFFVVNISDDPSFFLTIEKLGEMFCQDSVLMIPKGGDDAYLLGTNNSEWPGLGNKEMVGKFRAGREAEFMTKVKNRPFDFHPLEENLETYKKLSRNSRWVVSLKGRKTLKILE